MTSTRILFAAIALLGAVASACSIPSASATICSSPDAATTCAVTLELPSESATEWQPVENYLEHRCGGLDCHGDTQRNFIVYGLGGLRIAAYDGGLYDLMPPPTQPAEYAATYRSLVGLEPVVMSEVVEGHGGDPELLTFVRKAEGLEAHKGGTLIVLGTDAGAAQDTCITSWLQGNTNATACTQAENDTP